MPNWDTERDELYALLLPLVIAAAQDGALSALDMLPDGGAGVDMEAVTLGIVQWAQEYTAQLADGITQTTRRFVTERLMEITDRDTLLVELSTMLGMVRAELIGVTEITAAYAQGNREAWIMAGLSLMTWRTAGDDLVCPICQPMNGQIAPLGIGFNIGGPPAHARCRCWLSPVMAEVLGVA
jgi:SPP1 gp7 family putative phage head morphogenesis protein